MLLNGTHHINNKGDYDNDSDSNHNKNSNMNNSDSIVRTVYKPKDCCKKKSWVL